MAYLTSPTCLPPGGGAEAGGADRVHEDRPHGGQQPAPEAATRGLLLAEPARSAEVEHGGGAAPGGLHEPAAGRPRAGGARGLRAGAFEVVDSGTGDGWRRFRAAGVWEGRRWEEGRADVAGSGKGASLWFCTRVVTCFV